MTAGVIARAFTPARADDVPVTGDLLRRVEVELTGVVTVDVDVTGRARAERRAARIGNSGAAGDRSRLAQGQGIGNDSRDGGAGRDARTGDGGTDRHAGRAGDGEGGRSRRGGGGGRSRRAEVDALAADVRVTRVGVVREIADDDAVLADTEAFVAAVGDVGGAAGAIAEDGIDREGVAAGEDDEFASGARDDGAALERRAGSAGAEEDTTRRDRQGVGRRDSRRPTVGAVSSIETQRVDRLSHPVAGVRVDNVEVIGRSVSGGRRDGSRIGRGRDPAAGILGTPVGRGRGARAEHDVSRAVGVGDQIASGAGRGEHAVRSGKRDGGRIGDAEGAALDAGQRTEVEHQRIRTVTGEDDFRTARADEGPGDGLRVGRSGGGEGQASATGADAVKLVGGVAREGVRLRHEAVGVSLVRAGGRRRADDEVRGVRDADDRGVNRDTGAADGHARLESSRAGDGDARRGRGDAAGQETEAAAEVERGARGQDVRRVGVGGEAGVRDGRGGRGAEGELQGADTIRLAGGDARRAGLDGGGTRVGLLVRVEIEDAGAELHEAAGTGKGRAVGARLGAIADAQGDGVRGTRVILQGDVDVAVEATDREDLGGDGRVEDDRAVRFEERRQLQRAEGERVGVLQDERAAGDGAVAEEGVGAGKRQGAVAGLGDTTADAGERTVCLGIIADGAGELNVVAVGVEDRRAEERDAARDGRATAGDVGRRAGSPADGAAEGREAARAGAEVGRSLGSQDLQGAGRREREAAREGVRTRQRGGVADDDEVAGDAAIVRDVTGVGQVAAAAAEAEEARVARGIGTRVGHVAHAGAEAHARKIVTRLAEIEVRGRGGRRERDGARAAPVGETTDVDDRGERVADDGTTLGDDEEAAGLVARDCAGVDGAAVADGNGAVVDGERRGEGADAREGKRAGTGLDEATGAIRGVKGRDADARAGATAAKEGDGRDGASRVGTRARDHDAGDLAAAVDDGVAGGRRTAGEDAGGAEADERSADVAGAAGDGKVGLGHARAFRGADAGHADVEAVGVDRDDTGRRGAEAAVVDRAVEVGIEGDVPRVRRRQDARRGRRVGANRATGKVVITEVIRPDREQRISAGVVRDARVAAEGDEAGGKIEEGLRIEHRAAVTDAQDVRATVVGAARDIDRAERVACVVAVQDDAEEVVSAGRSGSVDITTGADGELGVAAPGVDEPRVARAVVQGRCAADIAHSDAGICCAAADVDVAAARAELVKAAGQVEVTVAFGVGDELAGTAGIMAQDDVAGGLVIDGNRAERVGSLRGEERHVAADVDDSLTGAVAVLEQRGGRGTDVATRDIQGAGVDGRIAGVEVAARERLGAETVLGQGECEGTAVADHAAEVHVGVVAADGEGRCGRHEVRAAVLDEAIGTGKGADDIGEGVQGQHATIGGHTEGGLRAEDVGRIGLQGNAIQRRRTRIGRRAADIEDRTGTAGEGQVVADQAGDATGEGERGAVGAGVGDVPGLAGTEDERGANRDRAGVAVDRDTVRGGSRRDRQGRGLGAARGDHDAGDAGRIGSELEAADGEVAVERGDIRGRRRIRRAEDDLVRDTREAQRVRGAGGVGEEVRVEIGVVEARPADVGTDAPVEVRGERRGDEADRGIRGVEREREAAEGGEITDREGAAAEAALRGDQVILAGLQAGKAGEVQEDLVRDDGRAGGDDTVVVGGRTELEAEGRATRGAGAEVQAAGRGRERQGLAEAVEEVQNRTGGDGDARGRQRRGRRTRDVKTTGDDGGRAGVGEDGTREVEGTDAGLDDRDVVLVRAGAADGADISRHGVLVDREGRVDGSAADDGVHRALAERTQRDGGAGAAVEHTHQALIGGRGRGRGAEDELGRAEDAGNGSADGDVGTDDGHALDEAAMKQRDAGRRGGGRHAQREDRGGAVRDGSDDRAFGNPWARDRLADDQVIEDSKVRNEDSRGTRNGGRTIDDEASGSGLDVDGGGTGGGRDAAHIDALQGAGREARGIDRDGRSGTRQVEAGVGDSDAGDRTAGDRGARLGRSGTQHTAIGIDVEDRSRHEPVATDEGQDVGGGQAGERSERPDGLVHRAGGVTELEHAIGGGHAEVERGGRIQAVIRACGQAAREDESSIGDGGGTEVGRDGSAAEDEVSRTGLREAADAGAGQSADRTGEGEVVRADVERTARGQELQRTGGEVGLRESVGQLKRTARENDVAGGAADVAQRREAEDAFVDRGLLAGAATGHVGRGKFEGAATRLR